MVLANIFAKVFLKDHDPNHITTFVSSGPRSTIPTKYLAYKQREKNKNRGRQFPFGVLQPSNLATYDRVPLLFHPPILAERGASGTFHKIDARTSCLILHLPPRNKSKHKKKSTGSCVPAVRTMKLHGWHFPGNWRHNLGAIPIYCFA